MEYEFTLKYQLDDSDCDLEDLLERLGAGCDDALVGIGQAGRIALNFTRQATSAKQALLSAMANVRDAIPTAKLIEAGPDFVGLTDAAELVKMSRQNLRKLMTAHFGNFPVPVHDGNSGLWHLVDLLNWLEGKGDYQVPRSIVEVSAAAKKVNQVKESLAISRADFEEMAELVA